MVYGYWFMVIDLQNSVCIVCSCVCRRLIFVWWCLISVCSCVCRRLIFVWWCLIFVCHFVCRRLTKFVLFQLAVNAVVMPTSTHNRICVSRLRNTCFYIWFMVIGLWFMVRLFLAFTWVLIGFFLGFWWDFFRFRLAWFCICVCGRICDSRCVICFYIWVMVIGLWLLVIASFFALFFSLPSLPFSLSTLPFVTCFVTAIFGLAKQRLSNDFSAFL